MDKDEKMAKAVEGYNNILFLLAKEDRIAAYNLLKQINLPLVKKHYKDDFKVNPKLETQFNLISAMGETLEVEADYKKMMKGESKEG
ncbi:MAG: hypothetical protein ACHQ2F_03240 [Desulfobaccales bacterium]